MEPSTSLASGFVTALVLMACGGGEPAQSPAAAPSASPPAAAEAPPSAAPAPSAEAPKKKQRPLDVSSLCSEVVTVVFADDPKSAGAGKRTIAPNASIDDAPRDPDGNQTVWLLDGNGEPLVKVRVTRGMKRVEVGKSCRTLDAR